jgi:hypothetical protein
LKDKQATALTTIIDGSLPFNGADFSRMDSRHAGRRHRQSRLA